MKIFWESFLSILGCVSLYWIIIFWRAREFFPPFVYWGMILTNGVFMIVFIALGLAIANKWYIKWFKK
jgi:hypothetical protein